MIRLYRDCDELIKWNFDQIVKTKDLRFLIPGFTGYEDFDLPEDAPEVWNEILNEYSKKTSNNKTITYFELLADISDLENRVYFAQILISQLANRHDKMSEEIRKEYIERLRDFRFYLNTGKPLKDELLRLLKQLQSVEMKIKSKLHEKKEFEEKNFDGEGSSTISLKVKIQKALKVSLDLKIISVTEWLMWVDEAINNKQAV